MVWFRQAASHYPSQCWQIYVAILRHNVLSNFHTINGDSRTTNPFARGNHRWQVVLTKNQCCRAFVFVLLLAWINRWTNSRVAHGWRRYDANVISLYWLLVIFKMLQAPMEIFKKCQLPCSASYIGYHEFQFYHSKIRNYSCSICLVHSLHCLLITKLLKVQGHQQV